METSLFQDKIKKSSGQEKDIAVKRLAENKKQIKALQAELLQSKKINKNIAKQEEAHKKVKKGIEATEQVAKQLVKTVEPVMIGGGLDIPAIGEVDQGLGGTLEKFIEEFYLDLMILAKTTLAVHAEVASIFDKHLNTVKQDFEEL